MAGDPMFSGLANFAERGLNALGRDPAGFAYEHQWREAESARLQAATDSIMEELRRQQADERALDLVFQARGIGPEKGRALLRQQDLEAALEQQKKARMGNTILGLQIDEMKKTPLQREQEQWEAFFGGLTGAMKNVFGSPEEAQDYAQTTQALQMARQADAYQKDQAIEQMLSQAEVQSGVPMTLAAKRQASDTFDSMVNKFGVPPDQAMQMLGSSLTPQSLGMPSASSLGQMTSPQYMTALSKLESLPTPEGRLGGGRPAEPAQVAWLRDYIGTAGGLKQGAGLREILARYGVKKDADIGRLSYERADRLQRTLLGQGGPRMGFFETLLAAPQPTLESLP